MSWVKVISHVVIGAVLDEANEDVDALGKEAPGAQEGKEDEDV